MVDVFNLLGEFSNEIQAIASVVTAIVAVWGVFMAKGTLKAAREANVQSKEDSIAQSRPYVYVELRPSLAGNKCLDICIINCGKTSAKDLVMDFSDWPEEEDGINNTIKQMFRTPRTLHPGAMLRSYWSIPSCNVEGFGQSGTDGRGRNMGMPTEGRVTVVYSSSTSPSQEYSEEFELLFSQSGLWPMPDIGPDVGDLQNCERKFYLLGQSIASAIRELGR